MPKLLTQSSKKIVATILTAFFVIGFTLANFEKTSVITTMYWVPLFNFGKQPRWSMAMNLRGFVTENNRNFLCFLLIFQIRAQDLPPTMAL